MTRGVRVCSVALALAAAPPAVLAQGGGFAPLVLELPAAVRAQGMGGAWFASRDPDAVFFNPANAGGSTGVSVGASRYGSASTFAHAATGIPFGSKGIALGVAWLDYGALPGSEIPRRSIGERGPDDGLSATAVASAYMTLWKVRWGAAARFQQERVTYTHDAVASFDIGAARELGWATLALVAQNLGPQITVRGTPTDLPTRFTAGAGTFGRVWGPLDVSASLAASVRRDGFVSPAGGVEFSYSPLEGYSAALRLGAQRGENASINPFSLGWSIAMDRFSLDYAFQDLRGSLRGGVHSVGLRVR